MKHKEIMMYGIVGLLTTLVYFIVRFSILHVIGSSLIAVILAQISSIIFAFLGNKILVFLDENWEMKQVITQFFLFFSARLAVFFLDISITYLAIDKYGDYFISLLGFDQINYNQGLFHSPLLVGFIGSATVLNEFFFVIIIQLLAILLNYIMSKKWVFKKS